jgi:cytochrome c553
LEIKMKAIPVTFALALATIGVGCTNLERSRDLANPNVPPRVTALQVCSNCHGVDGNSVSPNFPRLAGQQAGYMVAQLEHFRSHQRSDPPGFIYMWGITSKLTDAQIKGLAEYYAGQVPRPNAPVDGQKMAAGKEIYEKGVPAKETPPCISCHGQKAEGLASFPRLANQHEDYTMKQLNVFQNTEGRPDTPMKEITHLLTAQEMEAVAGYLQALPGGK